MRTKRKKQVTVGDLLSAPEAERAYEEELLFGRVQEQILVLLEKNGMRQHQLAGTLNVSEGRVSQMLSGENMTLKTLAGIGWALGFRFDVMLEPIGPADIFRQPDEDLNVGLPVALHGGVDLAENEIFETLRQELQPQQLNARVKHAG